MTLVYRVREGRERLELQGPNEEKTETPGEREKKKIRNTDTWENIRELKKREIIMILGGFREEEGKEQEENKGKNIILLSYTEIHERIYRDEREQKQ